MGHHIAFGVLLIFAIVELYLAAYLTAKYNANHNFPNLKARCRVRYLLFTSIWTIVFATAYLIGFFVSATSLFASVVSHFVFLFLTWILWLAAAVAITQMLGGTLNCDIQTYFAYCCQLNELEAFAWVIWAVLTIMLVFVFIRGIQSSKRGDGLKGTLVEA
jgi:hypothetical protein